MTTRNVQSPPHTRKVYLGDSVYVCWNQERYQLVLTTGNGDDGPSNTICLGAEVVGSLLNYLKQQFPDAPIWRKPK